MASGSSATNVKFRSFRCWAYRAERGADETSLVGIWIEPLIAGMPQMDGDSGRIKAANRLQLLWIFGVGWIGCSAEVAITKTLSVEHAEHVEQSLLSQKGVVLYSLGYGSPKGLAGRGLPVALRDFLSSGQCRYGAFRGRNSKYGNVDGRAVQPNL